MGVFLKHGPTHALILGKETFVLRFRVHCVPCLEAAAVFGVTSVLVANPVLVVTGVSFWAKQDGSALHIGVSSYETWRRVDMLLTEKSNLRWTAMCGGSMYVSMDSVSVEAVRMLAYCYPCDIAEVVCFSNLPSWTRCDDSKVAGY
eukprot:gene15592-biopygen4327